MAFDGITMKFLVDEISEKIIGGRIDKIYQIDKNEIDIYLRGKGENLIFKMSIDPTLPFFCLTQKKSESPIEPPMFTMYLRKNLIGGRILSVTQNSYERIVHLTIEAHNEMGDLVKRTLSIEIMGRHSNVILSDTDSGVVMDSLKRVPEYLSRVRPIIPGVIYSEIGSDKLDICNVTNEEILALYDSSKTKDIKKFTYTTFLGISPSLVESFLIEDDLLATIHGIQVAIKDRTFAPYVITAVGQAYPVDFGLFSPMLTGDHQILSLKSSINEMVEDFYIRRNKDNFIKHKASSLRKTIAQRTDLLRNKLVKLQDELIAAENADIYKIQGELIIANLYRLEKGMNELVAENYYSQDLEPITVKMDVRLSPTENSQKYYKKYQKLKNAKIELDKQLIEAQSELDYLENILVSLDNSEDTTNVEEIMSELAESGYVKRKYLKNGKQKKIKSKPLSFLTSSGMTILCGKNNYQNDTLTLKESSNSDYWFHTKDIPGSHVILKCEGKEPTDQDLEEAANIAAYHSKARLSSQVPVDYTRVKNVRKPSGAKPGMVIYDKNKTLYVTPNLQT